MSWRLLLATLLPVLVLYGADPDPRWLELRRIANAAVRAGNFSQLRTALLELQPLMPGNARNAYLMAVAEARLGKPAAALARLQQWADMGIVLDLAADPNFASLRVIPPFAEILRQDLNRCAPCGVVCPAAQKQLTRRARLQVCQQVVESGRLDSGLH